MKKAFSWRKILARLAVMLVFLIVLGFTLLYYFQEKLLFHPEVLTEDHAFTFPGDFEEVYIPVEKEINLHGVLFKAENTKGLVFYLHGNGGSVNGWGNIADTYLGSGYDVFIPDYRGYGKSDGNITSEEQIHGDVEKAYQLMQKQYDEKDIIIAGYSIGTGFAAKLAAGKNIKALLLQAPYYSMSGLVSEKMPYLPGFITRYKIDSYKFLERVTAPVYILHGTADRLIPFSHAQRLIRHAKPRDVLIPIEGGGHNIKDREDFKNELRKILK